MTPIVLDTHAWVWWLTRPDRLSRTQRATIDRTRQSTAVVMLSIISCWEVALLCQRGKLRFSTPVDAWLQRATTVPGLVLIPLTLPVLVTAARLTNLRDPADMLIVATAQQHGASLVTSDTRIEAANLVAVIA
ncbi:MAG TPA: type II toxin-antitoxin system VapC family toxin [Candidatus Binatia bacterium]|jgi:PIN domain nuclease of toxin-antitoxin system|nr:type II toxin-antitoxin system VapC family toxin [Candidatus Binatia bacterium]